MPELPEVEFYRRLAEKTIGLKITSIVADDSWYLKKGTTAEELRHAAVGAKVKAARRIGKLMLLDLDNGETLGLRFGMAGTLVFDKEVGMEGMAYSSNRLLPKWDRFTLNFGKKKDLRINDPRRLGGVQLNPDESELGPDALSLTLKGLREAIGTSTAPIKARMMDQARIAGIGNLIADETLYRAGIDPARQARSLSDQDLTRLKRHLSKVVDDFIAHGGSHTGGLMAERHRGGVCPKDGTELLRRTVGGRTTFSCPKHQH